MMAGLSSCLKGARLSQGIRTRQGLVVPEERNALIHPGHPACSSLV
jgi:hypothetical protein